MNAALDRPGVSTLFTQWTVQPVAIVLVLVLAVAYWRGVRALRATGRSWSTGRSAIFALGLVLLTWASCGMPQVYDSSVYWIWTSQMLGLWLGVPILILVGHPVQLARAVSGPDGLVPKLLAARVTKVVGNPLVGPALVPILSALLFFGPVAGWSITWSPVGWVLQFVLVVVGAIMVVPLVGLDDEASSLAVGLSLAIGSFELVLDALPGVILRLHTGLVTTWFDHREVHPWSFGELHDQQIAGGVLWCIAELIDLPFLVLVFQRWQRADARDAARIDAVLAAERAARRGLESPVADGGEVGVASAQDAPDVERDVPWWLSDPAMQKRLKRHP